MSYNKTVYRLRDGSMGVNSKVRECETHIDWYRKDDIIQLMRWIQVLINPCIHRNWKSLTVLLYDIKSNLN
jgi:hypothetical protein